ncbi:hypothetical protein SUGI_0337850 [Cryptomeria japonica]|nr:hypothetical protein SUGI_0337850 [Cryptomeria japonica]
MEAAFYSRRLGIFFLALFLCGTLLLEDASCGRELNSRGNTPAPRQKQNVEVGNNLIGSSPPNCKNKCMGCTPCNPGLTVPPCVEDFQSNAREGHYYYNLSWKCRCRNRTFQP